MKGKIAGLFVVLFGLMLIACPLLKLPKDKTPSTIVFIDGNSITKQLGSGSYINAVTGVGDGALSYTSSNKAIASVNAETGEVNLIAGGTTVITATRAETDTFLSVSASYSLTVTAITPSTIIFADGLSVTKQLGSGPYTNVVSGVGDGAISYTSDTPETATVNATTGEVALYNEPRCQDNYFLTNQWTAPSFLGCCFHVL